MNRSLTVGRRRGRRPRATGDHRTKSPYLHTLARQPQAKNVNRCQVQTYVKII